MDKHNSQIRKRKSNRRKRNTQHTGLRQRQRIMGTPVRNKRLRQHQQRRHMRSEVRQLHRRLPHPHNSSKRRLRIFLEHRNGLRKQRLKPEQQHKLHNTSPSRQLLINPRPGKNILRRIRTIQLHNRKHMVKKHYTRKHNRSIPENTGPLMQLHSRRPDRTGLLLSGQCNKQNRRNCTIQHIHKQLNTCRRLQHKCDRNIHKPCRRTPYMDRAGRQDTPDSCRRRTDNKHHKTKRNNTPHKNNKKRVHKPHRLGKQHENILTLQGLGKLDPPK